MDAILGKNLIVSVGGTAIAGAKSCRLQISGENIERASATDATDATWREFIAGRKTWTVACDHLLPRTGTPLRSSAAMVNTVVTLTVGVGQDTLSGSALVKTWEVSGAVGTLAVGSFQFQGSGPLQ